MRRPAMPDDAIPDKPEWLPAEGKDVAFDAHPVRFTTGDEGAVMSVASPAPAEARNASIPDGVAMDTWTAAGVLGQARDIASTLDPTRATLYRSMPPSRWLQVIDLGADLLTTHAGYRLHPARRRGRRQHAAEMHEVLDETNSANLVAAVAMMLVMGRVMEQLPRGT
jgi:hypothetical protein